MDCRCEPSSSDLSHMSTTVQRYANMTSQALMEAYRCPEDICQFGVVLDAPERVGHFRFGPDNICYGPHSGERGESAKNAQYDAMVHLRAEGDVPVLPFNPDEIIDNLRWERYTEGSAGTEKDLDHVYGHLFAPGVNSQRCEVHHPVSRNSELAPSRGYCRSSLCSHRV